MVIAIDGPAGAGKSTVARGVAGALGFTYLDSGAMYRGVALKTLRAGVDPADADAAGDIARGIDLRLVGAGLLLDGDDVSAAIRTPEVTKAASVVSAHPGVRRAMVERQRAMIDSADYVAEGRDIGTVVSPDSPLKVFLVATAGVNMWSGSMKPLDRFHSTAVKVTSVITCRSRPSEMLKVCEVKELQSCSMRCSGLPTPRRVSSMW